MDQSDKISIFRQYMLCGHGRCFSMIAQDKELYRETVLYGCLNDIAYDLQCEGSRAQFMYNLALKYDDHGYFLNAVIEKFRSPIANEDWHTIILAAIAKCPKNGEQKIRMSRKTTKAYCRMVRRMTQTDGFSVSITGYFAIAASIIISAIS